MKEASDQIFGILNTRLLYCKVHCTKVFDRKNLFAVIITFAE